MPDETTPPIPPANTRSRRRPQPLMPGETGPTARRATGGPSRPRAKGDKPFPRRTTLKISGARPPTSPRTSQNARLDARTS